MMRSKQNLKEIDESESKDQCCTRKCGDNISHEDVNNFRQDFKSLQSYESRSAFIIANVKESNDGRRGSLEHFLRGHRVCQKFFCESLEISKMKITTLLQKKQIGVTKDLRGQHQGNALSNENHDEIIADIMSYPRTESHYSRETSESLYLDSNEYAAKMHRNFVEKWNQKHQDESKPPCVNTYKKVFKSLNLKFKNLKSDTCKTCDKFKNMIHHSSTAEKDQIQHERECHWDDATAIRDEMNDDFRLGKGCGTVQGICYDLEKTFLLPKATSGSFYYTRNFSTINCRIHDAKTDQGYFHIWTETDAGRGPQEIGSCLLKFLENHLEPEATTLILWADSCGGQNRNYILPLFLHRFLAAQSKLEVIIMKFLKSGHSFNICDTDFSSVEKAMRRTEEVFTPDDVIKVIEESRPNKPFDVTRMTGNDFYSSKTLIDNITKREKNEESKEKVYWLSTHEIVLRKSDPFRLHLNYDVKTKEVIFNHNILCKTLILINVSGFILVSPFELREDEAKESNFKELDPN